MRGCEYSQSNFPHKPNPRRSICWLAGVGNGTTTIFNQTAGIRANIYPPCLGLIINNVIRVLSYEDATEIFVFSCPEANLRGYSNYLAHSIAIAFACDPTPPYIGVSR